MGSIFETKLWKVEAILAYIGMLIGILTTTAVIPLSIIALGETESTDVALHSVSLKRIGYWLVGLGMIALITNSLTVLSTIVRSRGYRIVVVVLQALNLLLTISILIVGTINTDSRKEYFQNVWDNMNFTTKYLIQDYYSCCGFESHTEWTSSLVPVDISCIAINSTGSYWPNGCFERVISSSLSAPQVVIPSGESVTVGSDKINVFLAFFLTVSTILIALHSTNLSVLLFAIVKSPASPSEGEDNPYGTMTYQNTLWIVRTMGLEIKKKDNEVANGMTEENTTNHEEATGNKDMIEDDKISTLKPADDNSTLENISEREHPTPERKKTEYGFRDNVTASFEKAFFWLGVQVGSHPKMTIFFSLLITVAFSLGFLQRYESLSAGAFLDPESQILQEFANYSKIFLITEQNQFLIIEDNDDGNILDTDNIQSMVKLDSIVKDLSSSKGFTFSSICYRVAANCKQRSLFELWSFDAPVLTGLTTNLVHTAINADPLTSPIFGDVVNIKDILGSITRNSAGDIVSAKAHLFHYVTRSAPGDDWEDLFITLGRANHSGITVYTNARSSATKETSRTFQSELPLLFAGFGLIFVYILLMTGKFSRLEHRAYIALLGVATAGLSMAAGIGVSASFGLTWSNLHLIVPFLLIGIGVDDMFILLQAWNVVEDNPELRKLSVPIKSGHVLRIAGVSITVTSVTDLIAFAVGASSDLAAYASFSVYAAMCIILLFFLECTFFLACTTLDQARKERRYDACLACCLKVDDSYKAGKCGNRELVQTFFEDVLGRLVQKPVFAVISILITLALTGVMAWGFYQLKVSYDPDWYLPLDSYVIDYNAKEDLYFNTGSTGAVYILNTDFYNERVKIHALYDLLSNNPNINQEYLVSWFENFHEWSITTKGVNTYLNNAYASESVFYADVMEYLTGVGKRFSNDVVFQNSVIIGSAFPYRHVVVSDDADNVDIVDTIRANCDALQFTGQVFPYGRSYFLYEIVRIIRREVYRNIGITMLCVLAVVLPLVASLQMSFWIVLCVVFTTVDVAGSMYFAGLSIEASTIITLLLSVGLAVDYAAHVGHKFLTLRGTRAMRIRVTLGQIGPAVFNGGFSTFLALVLLAASDTYSYRVFFTVFVCVIGYGLWNGLFFLPAVLGIIGPAPNATAIEATLSHRHVMRKTEVNAMKETQEQPQTPTKSEI